jgi:hypothetical protein
MLRYVSRGAHVARGSGSVRVRRRVWCSVMIKSAPVRSWCKVRAAFVRDDLGALCGIGRVRILLRIGWVIACGVGLTMDFPQRWRNLVTHVSARHLRVDGGVCHCCMMVRWICVACGKVVGLSGRLSSRVHLTGVLTWVLRIVVVHGGDGWMELQKESFGGVIFIYEFAL